MIAPTISLRNASPKEFAQALLGSAQNILKLLEKKMQGVSKNPHLPYKRFAQISSQANRQKGATRNATSNESATRKKTFPTKTNICIATFAMKNMTGVCPMHGPTLLVCDTKVRKDDPQKARKSLPLTLSIGFSSIKGAGLGVWTEMPWWRGWCSAPTRARWSRRVEQE
ncbi:hypothetical protein CEXT_211631 [Caerostris extrusa]|uniref:Uncharacterized protein n=1 Tax=Caerostris extrusa TaxID=172846 RepID=A0AAV4PZ90_CAEEX|nr:hypothetical protein CEXT_211631 [Caerostris extrusa]